MTRRWFRPNQATENRFSVQQVFVAMKIGQAVCLRHMGSIGQCHIGLDALVALSECLHLCQEAQVKKQSLIIRVIRDVGHLIGVQARIERVQHGPRARHRVVQLEMPMVVPGHGSHTGPGFDAECAERLGHLARPCCHGLEGLPVDVAFDLSRNNPLIPMVAFRVDQQRRDQQRLVHHFAVHGSASHQ